MSGIGEYQYFAVVKERDDWRKAVMGLLNLETVGDGSIASLVVLLTNERDEGVIAKAAAEKQRDAALQEIERIKGVGFRLCDHLSSMEEKRVAAERQRDEARAEAQRLKDVLHHDRSGLAKSLEAVMNQAKAYSWIAEGRGCYAWDDDRYREEAGRMVKTIVEMCNAGLIESGNLAHKECCGRGKAVRREDLLESL